MNRHRDRYLHVLCLVALVHLTAVHAFGQLWLPLLVPSFGVLLALTGALAAAAVDQAASARVFLRQRVWRLLLPFWAFGAAAVTAMLALGWRADEQAGAEPLTWGTAWFWLMPLADPPASVQGSEWVGLTSFVGTSLWLLVLSPALLWLFRRWPLRLMSVPIVTLLLMGIGLVSLTGRTYDVVGQLCAYLCCWLLGFARHDGTLRRLPLARTVVLGVALMAAGAGFAVWQQNQYGSWNITDIPLAAGLHSLGGVLLLLRFDPRCGWLDRVPPLRALAEFLSRRVVTAVLWANVAIATAAFVLARTPLARFDAGGPAGTLLFYGTACTLLLVAVLALGRLEEIPVRRPRVVLQDNVAVEPAQPSVPEPAPVPGVERLPAAGPRPGQQLLGRPGVDHLLQRNTALEGPLAAVALPIELPGGVRVGVDGELAAELHRETEQPARRVEALGP
jgi:hypothetical protein